MKKIVNYLSIFILTFSLMLGTISVPNVFATDIPEDDLENSVENIISTIEENLVIEEDGISVINKGKIINKIDQKDIKNLKKLAEEQGIKYNRPINKQTIVDIFLEGVEISNEDIKDGELTVLEDGSFIESDDDEFYVQGGSTYDKSYWWGKKRYKSTYYARKWARDLDSAGHLNTSAAFLAGAVFGGVGAVPNGLSAVYAYNLADKINYRNSLNNRGIIANLTYALVFTTASQ